MEDSLLQIYNFAVGKFPIVASIYGILSGLYITFCAVAAMTATDKDDKIATKLKMFFSLPNNKK